MFRKCDLFICLPTTTGTKCDILIAYLLLMLVHHIPTLNIFIIIYDHVSKLALKHTQTLY